MIPNLSRAWPLRSDPADPWAAEEWLDELGSYDNYRLFGGTLDRAAHDRADQAFLERWRQVLRGEAERGDLDEGIEVLRLPTDITHDRRPPQIGPSAVTDEALADIVEDTLPDVGLVAPDRFLGPWADEPFRRELVRSAAVHLCWVPLLDLDGKPCDRWANNAPKPSIARRKAVRAVQKAPPMLWSRDWKPLLPLLDHFVPDGPVSGDIVPLHGPVEAVLARLTPVDDGWHCNGAIGLGAVPPLDRLRGRLHLELLRERRHERRLTWEVFLRRRPEVLYRSCMTWCWLEAFA